MTDTLQPPCFLSDLDTRDLAGKKWRLLQPLVFESKRYAGIFVSPDGFETDYASIPQWLHWLFPKSGKHNRAAVLHDACYAGVTTTLSGLPQHVVKSVADALFLEAMQADGVEPWRARIMYVGVELFGDPVDRMILESKRRRQRMVDPGWTIACEQTEVADVFRT
jgi:hypothetical protein